MGDSIAWIVLAATAATAIGYLLGSIPFGLVLTRLAGIGDIRATGSGNIGATNVLRAGGKGLAAATLAGDMLKGAVAVWIFVLAGRRDLAIVAGLGSVFGHVFPVWLGFKGGKGVATYAGVLAALAWPIAAVFGAVWLAIAASTRYSSLAALVASAIAPVLLWWRDDAGAAAVFALLTALIWLMHRGNIARLAAGTESKIGKRADDMPGS